MKRRDHHSEAFDQILGQSAAARNGIKQRPLLKTAHFQYIFDRRPRVAQSGLSSTAADWHDFKVDLRRGSAVEAQFLLAEMPARLKRRKVEETQRHRFLDFVGELTGEQHPGNMRLDQFNVCHRVRIALRLHHRRDQRRHSAVWRGWHTKSVPWRQPAPTRAHCNKRPPTYRACGRFWRRNRQQSTHRPRWSR